MRYLLACAHTGDARSLADLREIMTCPVCDTRRKLLAVETREWHVRCQDCPYGRWCGASETDANSRANIHGNRRNHRTTTDYERHPETVEKVRDIFGRKVKNVITSDHDFRLGHKYDPAGVGRLLPRQGELDDVSQPDQCPF